MLAANRTDYVSVSDVLWASDWNLDRTVAFMHHWVPTSFKITVAYLAVVFAGQKVMEKCRAVDGKLMDYVLALWNFVFSLFSGIAAYKLLPELFYSIRTTGLVGSYCSNLDYYTDPTTGFWGWLFVMRAYFALASKFGFWKLGEDFNRAYCRSKALELGDTLFLVLRKRPVIFMHWYHHALTFVYAQITYSETQAWCRWSLALNLFVHTVMYFYFAVRALHVKTPRWVAQFITTIQIVQFIISCSIFSHLVYIKSMDLMPECQASWNVLTLGGVMYLSYLYLFAQFFYNAYIAKRHPSKTKKVE